jgi:hypothetical protein
MAPYRILRRPSPPRLSASPLLKEEVLLANEDGCQNQKLRTRLTAAVLRNGHLRGRVEKTSRVLKISRKTHTNRFAHEYFHILQGIVIRNCPHRKSHCTRTAPILHELSKGYCCVRVGTIWFNDESIGLMRVSEDTRMQLILETTTWHDCMVKFGSVAPRISEEESIVSPTRAPPSTLLRLLLGE